MVSPAAATVGTGDADTATLQAEAELQRGGKMAKLRCSGEGRWRSWVTAGREDGEAELQGGLQRGED